MNNDIFITNMAKNITFEGEVVKNTKRYRLIRATKGFLIVRDNRRTGSLHVDQEMCIDCSQCYTEFSKHFKRAQYPDFEGQSVYGAVPCMTKTKLYESELERMTECPTDAITWQDKNFTYNSTGVYRYVNGKMVQVRDSLKTGHFEVIEDDCIYCGVCWSEKPDLFGVDNKNNIYVKQPESAMYDRQIGKIIQRCPTNAIVWKPNT